MELERLMDYLPDWAQDWLSVLLTFLELGIIVLLAWLTRYVLGKLFNRVVKRHRVPIDVAVPLRTLGGWAIIVATLLLILERLGVSASVLWTAITGFAAVAAVAFFAAWSVLSNIFCAFLIFTTQPFRVGDELEILDASDKIGIHGRVMAINLLYTVLSELGREDGRATLVQIPNSAFFQKTVRRWQSSDTGSDLSL